MESVTAGQLATAERVNEAAHSSEECLLCATKPKWYSSNSHKKVPHEGLEPFMEELLLMHIPSRFRCCVECGGTRWPCETNKILHAELKRRKEA